MNTKIQITAICLWLIYAGAFQVSAGYYRTAGTGELPACRYYDKLSSAYPDSAYRPEYINAYWGELGYGNTNPDPWELLKIELEIMNLEQKDLNVSEALAKSS